MCPTSNLATNLKFFEVSPFLNVFIANAMSFPLPKPLYMAEQRAQSGKRWEVDRSVCSVWRFAAGRAGDVSLFTVVCFRVTVMTGHWFLKRGLLWLNMPFVEYWKVGTQVAGKQICYQQLVIDVKSQWQGERKGMTESSETRGHLSLSLPGCYQVVCMKLFPGPCLGSFLFELFT